MEMLGMARNDLNYIQPDSSGRRVCGMALRELSRLAVEFVDEANASASTNAVAQHR
jgi:hypothetical protein